MSDYDLDILQLAAKGYCCSQIVLKIGLELRNEENPTLVRAASALCRGIAGKATCGALTGAACLLGSYCGKGEDQEEEDERLQLMLDELQGWFTQYCQGRFSGINCGDIVPDSVIDPMVCGGLVADCFEKVLSLLVENDIDPEHPYE